MPLAYCIICLQNTNPVNQTTAISTLDASLAYATFISRPPHDSFTYVTFDLAIDKDEGIVIEGYEVYWNVRQPNLRLMELVMVTMTDAVKERVEFELGGEESQRSECAFKVASVEDQCLVGGCQDEHRGVRSNKQHICYEVAESS
jgi:hypothetical protein